MPDLITSEEMLIDRMTAPSTAVVEAVSELEGDVVILGAGGKMGPTLTELLVRAGAKRVIGVSRFSDARVGAYLEQAGVEIVRADLLDEKDLARLPDAPNVLFLAGFKFGATGNSPMTWAMNAWLPGRIMRRYAGSRVIYVSSGNVYAYTPVAEGGADEDGEIGPVGEYAQSRLGGERIAEHLCLEQGTPLLIVRLFYATELRYGIIHDLGRKIHDGVPIDLDMGHVNQIWQGDANRYLARLFPLCSSPATILNLTGPDVLSVRSMSGMLGRRLAMEPDFTGRESDTALLGNARRLFDRLGEPEVPPERIADWVAHWIRIGGRSLDKPTGYESRTGRF
ncbi:MAG: NAD-dependent epimerase/dehydratase family protein [Gemmatimonadetes bacterium]|nr:NAD-dependent epimerase/dehydratase family protein [Gemmatimonadota bacterium]MYG86800.1 NAD-dependent epimerase/dehydratase family protein [Gemmatimonadota bacterium]MYJ88433.1 NAD-dependent epimerase/dehydratase family protein [Gemmatimonadota bacterium]